MRHFVAAIAILAVLVGCSVKDGSDKNCWMKEIPDSTPAYMMSIPGAHDACTAGVDEKYEFFRTQAFDIEGLWNAGVRAFDVRPAARGDQLGIFHIIADTHLTFDGVVNTLAECLKKNPSEFAVVIFRHEDDADISDNYESLMGSYMKSLPEGLAIRFRNDLTLGELRGHIVFFSRSAYENGPVGAYLKDWPDNTLAVNSLGESSPVAVQDHYEPEGKEDKLEALKTFYDSNVTSHFWTISHTSGYLKSGYGENAQNVNSDFADIVSSTKLRAGIVMTDFAGVDTYGQWNVAGKKLVDAIIANNNFASENVGGPIDRKAVVSRHKITINHTVYPTQAQVDNGQFYPSPSQVGNGHFAFSADITGLQTFTPLATLSDWGWHSFPAPEGVDPDSYRTVPYTTHGRTIKYWDYNPQQPEVSDYLARNPHRVNLGRLRFVMTHKDGSLVMSEEELTDELQTIDPWTGLVKSHFCLDGVPVDVKLTCHPERDIIAVDVKSDLLKDGRLSIETIFPYGDRNPTEEETYVDDYEDKTSHSSKIEPIKGGYRMIHTMDDLEYSEVLHFEGSVPEESQDSVLSYKFTPKGSSRMTFTCEFAKEVSEPVRVRDIEKAYAQMWEKYWMSGAAVDFSDCTDPRAAELERRVILSQYVMRMNEAGYFPPQEAGLVNNGWYGRYHFEMMWWHGAHFALWKRFDCLGWLDIYRKYMDTAKARAASEGRIGAKWPKCTANFNREWPNGVHAFIEWQQPHPIWFAETEYRANPSKEVVEKWKDIVFATADYMADVVFWDEDRKQYVLGPPLVLVSENTDALRTINPTFELSYFRYGLRTALAWADRLGICNVETAKWRSVLSRLAPLPVEDGVYETYEGIEEMWTKYNFEHPALTGVFGWLPGDGVDLDTFRRTYDKVLDTWQMDRVWGWDYMVFAMAAVRLGDPEKAIDYLTRTDNKIGVNEHGLSESWPFPYFPTSGGLLSTVAMMCGGWDGSQGYAPGFPKDGKWNVRYEGFTPMQ